MARSRNIVTILIKRNGGSVVHESALQFPLDKDPQEVAELIQNELVDAEHALADVFGFEPSLVIDSDDDDSEDDDDDEETDEQDE